MAFTIEERQTMGIHGLLPPRVKTQDEQVELCKLSINRYEDDLNKYIYLMGLLVSALFRLLLIFSTYKRLIIINYRTETRNCSIASSPRTWPL